MSIKMDGETDAQTQLRKAIMAINTDTTLSDEEKGRRRQQLLMGGWKKTAEPTKPEQKDEAAATAAAADVCPSTTLDENLKCAICFDLCERPVTAPCQHNFCLGCFNKWTNQGKKTCPTCRAPFPSKFAQNPRINTALIVAIRIAKNPVKAAGPAKEYKRMDNESRPDEAFVTERAQRAGRANASSGRIMVTIPNDHFGPIEPQHDPERNKGVLVGDYWRDRLDCRQWGAHFPHVAGIAGQSNVGAQSVVLSGGYEDDKDEGEWFLYTGSGGRDLSGNKRTNKVQSFDQEFESMNKALQMSCLKGYPVRVVRSFKEKRSAYAPTDQTPVRYDGIYRILRCWRKPGNQEHLICRYLFVRADNAPAPWSSAEEGDKPRLEVPKEAADEIKAAKGKVFEMAADPFWDYLEAEGKWGWAKPAPASQKVPGNPRPGNPGAKLRKKLSEHEKALKEFRCLMCKDTLKDPIRTPCGHNFCKGCLDSKFQGVSELVSRSEGSRSLRVKKTCKPCPACKTDIADWVTTAQVNREMAGVIVKLQEAVARTREEADKLEKEGGAAAATGAEDEDGEDVGEGEEVEDEEVAQGEEGGEGEEEEEGDAPGPSKGCGKKPAAAAPKEAPAAKKAKKSAAAAAAGAAVAKVVASPVKPEVAAAEAEAADGEEEEEKEEEVKGGAGPSSAAAAAVEAAEPAFKHAAALRRILDEFPEADEGLVRGLLEDQGGDEAGVADIRFTLKKLLKPAAKAKAGPKAPKAPTAATAKAAPKGRGKKGAAAAKEAEQGEEEQAGAGVVEAAAAPLEGGEQAGEEGAQAGGGEAQVEGAAAPMAVDDAEGAAGREAAAAPTAEDGEAEEGGEEAEEKEVEAAPAQGKAKAKGRKRTSGGGEAAAEKVQPAKRSRK